MTLAEFNDLIIVRAAVLGEQLQCLIVDGDVDCNSEHEEILCNLYRLFLIFETVNHPESLEALEELDPKIFEYYSNIITSIGGIDETDYIVYNNQFLSLTQYYTSIGSGGSGSGSSGTADFTPINGTGRNFETPTLYNQVHLYDTLDEFINAFLFPALDPNISSWSGSMKLNDSESFVALGLVEKGTIVREIKATAIAARAGTSSGLLTSFTTTMPSPTPASPTDISPDAANATQEWTTTVNDVDIVTWAGADQANKAFTVTVTDALGKTKTSSSIGYTMANRIYRGVAANPAEVNAAFIQGLDYVVDTDQYFTSFSLTVGSGEHGWVFYPASWGIAIFTDTSVNIAGGFTAISGSTELPNGTVVEMIGVSVLLTFENGYTELYRGYVTDNSNLGTITFKTTAS